MKFIEDAHKGRGCVFCGRRRRKTEVGSRKNLILYFGEFCFVMMNKYPYNNGHLMVIPYAHKSEISDLNAGVQQELIYLTGESVRILKKVLRCAGANCGMNIGKVAGAGIANHVHMHVVPRWQGDSNFMPVIGNAKSMPEYLKTTYKRLKPEFDKLGVVKNATFQGVVKNA